MMTTTPRVAISKFRLSPDCASGSAVLIFDGWLTAGPLQLIAFGGKDDPYWHLPHGICVPQALIDTADEMLSHRWKQVGIRRRSRLPVKPKRGITSCVGLLQKEGPH